MDAQNRVAYRRRGLNYPGNPSEGNQIALGGSQRYAQSSQASKSSSPAALFFSLLPSMFLPSSWTSGHHGEGIWNRRPSQGNIFGIVGTQGFFTGEPATDISEETPSISPVVEVSILFVLIFQMGIVLLDLNLHIFGDVLLAADCGCFPLDVAIESRIGVASVRFQ
jgi:hypothetical protein